MQTDDRFSAQIEVSKSIVNNFYQVDVEFPVTIALNTWDIIKAGLLPWAKSGIRKSIILKLPVDQDQVTHEMSHFALRKITKSKPLPLWFDEGLACYLSNMNFIGDKKNLKGKMLPDIISLKGFPGKIQWLQHMYLRKNTSLIYGQSYYLVAELLNTYGKSAVLEFINHLHHKDFEESFLASFGISVTGFYKKFISVLDQTD